MNQANLSCSIAGMNRLILGFCCCRIPAGLAPVHNGR